MQYLARKKLQSKVCSDIMNILTAGEAVDIGSLFTRKFFRLSFFIFGTTLAYVYKRIGECRTLDKAI